ncbi:MAG: hypothetical protein ABIK28_13220 [Planctomycetota bacterium]
MRRAGKAEEGMTLVEVLIAGTLGALLLLSLTAATGNVLDAYSVSVSEIELSRNGAVCMDTITKAVRNASKVTLTGTHKMTLNDAAGDETGFSWAGTPGDPLIMRVAGTDDYTLLPVVQDFSVQVNNASIEAEQDVETAETFISFDYFPGGDTWHVKEIGPNDYRGAEFTIPKEEEVEEIRLTQVGFRVGKTWAYHGDMQLCLSEARAIEHPIPFRPILATQDVANADIINAKWSGSEWWLYWMTIDLSEDFVVYPNRHYCLFLKGGGSSKACMIRVRQSNADPGPDNGIRMVRSTDGGSTWWPTLGEPTIDLYDIPFELTGVKVTHSTQTVQRSHSVDVTLTLLRNKHALTLKRQEHLRGGSYRP